MDWTKVTVYTTTDGIEPVSGRMMQLGITGLVIEDESEFNDFLEETKDNKDILWRVVLTHQSPYGSSYHGNYKYNKDANGNLPANASSDGIHFGPAHYRLWIEYIKRHTVYTGVIPQDPPAAPEPEIGEESKIESSTSSDTVLQ